MLDEVEALELRQGENMDALWFRVTILRSDLTGLGYERSDTSVV